MVDWMFVASEEATSGSVIAKHERMSPASSGSSHCRFCSGRAVADQHFHVPGVGRRAVEDLGRERQRAPHDFAERRVLRVGQARTVFAGRQKQVPESLGARPRLELLDERDRLPAIALVDLFSETLLVRIDVRVHEGASVAPADPSLSLNSSKSTAGPRSACGMIPLRAMSPLVRYQVRDRVAVITVDNPPVNALSAGVPEAISDAVERACHDSTRRRHRPDRRRHDVHRRRGHQHLQAAEDARAVHRTVAGGARTAEDSWKTPASRSSPRSTATRSAAASSSPWPAITASLSPPRRWVSPRCTSGSFPAQAARSGCRACAGRRSHSRCAPRASRSPPRGPCEAGIVDAVIDGDLLEGAIAFAKARAAGRGAPPHPRSAGQDRRSRRGHRRLPGRARDARQDGARRAGAVRRGGRHRGLPHHGLRRRLAARNRVVRRLRPLGRVESHAAPVLRRARGRQDSRRAERHAQPARSRAPPSSAPGRWAAASP